MLNEIKGSNYELAAPKVCQSFDNKLSREEKEAYEKVLREEEEE
jgi:hypothetical protein